MKKVATTSGQKVSFRDWVDECCATCDSGAVETVGLLFRKVMVNFDGCLLVTQK